MKLGGQSGICIDEVGLCFSVVTVVNLLDDKAGTPVGVLFPLIVVIVLIVLVPLSAVGSKGKM